MNQRKLLKKELYQLKSFKRELPRLIDCSEVYGDETYTEKDILEIDRKIEEINKQLIK